MFRPGSQRDCNRLSSECGRDWTFVDGSWRRCEGNVGFLPLGS
jgi:hypothetical protein